MAISRQLAIALDDLSSRFFLNLPKEELDSFERLFFQLEQAWWFYDDFYREPHPHLRLPKFIFRDFCLALFEQSGALRPHVPNFDRYFAQFRDYLSKVPVCGAILLDETMSNCLLVKGYNSRSWTFPKGKINQGEQHIDCAVREVLEETGANIASLVSDRHFLQAVVKGKSTNLYVVPNVPMDTVFSAQTRKEIADIRWFEIEALEHTDHNKFWSVTPFLYKLKAWLARHRHLANKPTLSSDKGRRKKSLSTPSKPLRRSITSDFADTFGCQYTSWPAEEMFAVNARLFGVESSPISNPNELSGLMADRRAMAGTIQWQQATEALKKQPPPDGDDDGGAGAGRSAFPLPPACGDAAAAVSQPGTHNVLLSFDLDDAGIMSHFFQA